MSNIKRLNRDVVEWNEHSVNFPNISLAPLDENLFVWHFNIFLDEVEAPVHGCITFPDNYPFDPPQMHFSRNINHQQVIGENELCLNLLDKTTGYYAGWSSAFSAASIMAQLSVIISELNGEMQADRSKLADCENKWKNFSCDVCGHNGGNSNSFYPSRRQFGVEVASPQTNKPLWDDLYDDVENIIFSFLCPSDLLLLTHVNVHLRQTLFRMKVYLWSRIRCFHSHDTFREFYYTAQDRTKSRDDIRQQVFGIGIEPVYWVNTNGTETEEVLKSLSLSLDVMTFGAFREGVNFSVWKDFQFTYCMPLYLNDMHGEVAMRMCERVVQQAYRKTTGPFDCILALRFLSKLMNTTIVQLMTELEGDANSVSLFTSTKALQGYMYVYHLLLGFTKKYPAIIDWARGKVEDFFDDSKRNKKNFPDLGEFIVYLTIVDVPWSKIGLLIEQESQTRGAKWILQQYPHLVATDRNTKISCIRLRQTWDSRIISHRLLMFQVYFLKNVCKFRQEPGLTLEDTLESYNTVLGHASTKVARDLQRKCREIFLVDDWIKYFDMIELPCPTARKLSHDLRLAIVESDRKGYHRFIETDVRDRRHEQSSLCICSGKLYNLDSNDVESDGEEDEKEIDTTRRNLDIAFSFDCTGSMGCYLDSVKKNISSIARKLSIENRLNVRFALVGYRDHAGEKGTWTNVTKVIGFCNLKKFSRELASFSVGGGGAFEAVADAWYDVLNLRWRRFSVKAVIHLADIAGHGLTDGRTPRHDPIQLARQMFEENITLYTIGCNLRNPESCAFYQGTAHLTGGLFLPIEDANNLGEIILETTLEGVALQDIAPRVQELIEKHRSVNPHVSRDQLAYLIHEDMKRENISATQVTFASSNVPEFSVKISECRNMKECVKIIEKVVYASKDIDGPLNEMNRKSFRKSIQKGWKIFAYESGYGWGAASVLAVNRNRTNITIHFDGYGTKYDRELPFDMENIRRNSFLKKVRIEKKTQAVEKAAISLDQTIRCIKRAEMMMEQQKHEERGCLYRTPEYSKIGAQRRYDDAGIPLETKLLRLPIFKCDRYEIVRVLDPKTQEWCTGKVVKIETQAYKIGVRVEVGGKSMMIHCAMNSRRLRKASKQTLAAPIASVRPNKPTQTSTRSSTRPAPSRVTRANRTNFRPNRPKPVARRPKFNKPKATKPKSKSFSISWSAQKSQTASTANPTATKKPFIPVGMKMKQAIEKHDVTGLQLLMYQLTRGEVRRECTRQFEDSKTLLHIAAELGNVRLVNMLLENGADPVRQDMFGRTPLNIVRQRMRQNQTNGEFRNYKIVEQKLMDVVRAKSLYSSAKRGGEQKSTVGLVLLRNLPPSFSESQLRLLATRRGIRLAIGVPVMIFVNRDKTRAQAQFAAECTANLSDTVMAMEGYQIGDHYITVTMDVKPRSVAVEAVSREPAEIVEENRSQSNQQQRNLVQQEMDPLMAAFTGNIGRLEYLLKVSDPRQVVNLIDINGRTPLHFAAFSGHINVVRLLLAYGANPLALDKNGAAPFDALRNRTDPISSQIRSLLIPKWQVPPQFPVPLAQPRPQSVNNKRPTKPPMVARVNAPPMPTVQPPQPPEPKPKPESRPPTAATSDVAADTPTPVPTLFCTGFSDVKKLTSKLRKKFSAFGSLAESVVVKKKNGRLVTFVTFNDVQSAQSAQAALHGQNTLGGTLIVEFARSKQNTKKQRVVLPPAQPSPLSRDDMVWKSALCVIPPEDIWDPIQTIRQKYDKGFDRWMPHINVLYPYVPARNTSEHVHLVESMLRNEKVRPFRVEFSGFGYFDRRPTQQDRDPEVYVFLKTRVIKGNKKSWNLLLSAIQKAYPNYSQRRDGFKPHLTVGQVARSRARQFVERLNSRFVASSFDVGKLCMISRSGFNTSFAVDHVVAL